MWRHTGHWSKLRANMEFSVTRVSSRILQHRMSLEMSAVVVQQFLTPRLRAGLLVGKTPLSTLDRWDGIIRIRRAALGAADMRWAAAALPKETFYLATAVPSLRMLAPAIVGEELMVTRCAQYPSSRTHWARTEGATLRSGVGNGARSRVGNAGNSRAAWGVRQLPPGVEFRHTPAPFVLPPGYLRRPQSTLWATDYADARRIATVWRPDKCPQLFRNPPSGPGAEAREPEFLFAFTDGSTDPGDRARGGPSGAAVVLADPQGTILLEHNFALRASGNNYLAEAAALVAAVLSVPGAQNLVIYTDCLSLKQALEGYFVESRRGSPTPDTTAPPSAPARRRILAAARPMINLFLAIAAARTGRV